VPPVVVATSVMLAVLAAGRLPVRAAAHRDVEFLVRAGGGPWRATWSLVRFPVLALLIFAAVAGRVGADRPTENLAPVLIVGLGWPALLLASATIPKLWEWLDPWDTLARPMTGSEAIPDGPAVDVRPAVLAAVAWTWFLGAYGATFSPRAVGTAVLGYTVASILAVALLGRAALARFEVFGLVASWAGLLARRRLRVWAPPRGAEVVCGALIGGLLFGALRLSGVWFQLGGGAGSSAMLLAFAAAAALLLVLTERTAAARGAAGTPAAAAVPVVVAVGLAVSLTNDRLWLAWQLLPAVLDDPLGRGWALLGGVEAAVSPSPLGGVGRVLVQLVILLLGGALASRTANARSGRAGRPAAASAAVLVGAAALAVSAV
jgi:hypothetical protein